MSAIKYFNDDCLFRLPCKRIHNNWLRAAAQAEGYATGDINYIFCRSEKLLEINRQFLGHDYYTDVITFDESDRRGRKIISGEIYIDIDTVTDNAARYGITVLHEVHRVMIHGLLHLCGYKDKTPSAAVRMRARENRYLRLLSKMHRTGPEQ